MRLALEIRVRTNYGYLSIVLSCASHIFQAIGQKPGHPLLVRAGHATERAQQIRVVHAARLDYVLIAKFLRTSTKVNRNIELKARLPDLEKAHQVARSLRTQSQDRERQQDTYLPV